MTGWLESSYFQACLAKSTFKLNCAKNQGENLIENNTAPQTKRSMLIHSLLGVV